MDCSLPGSSLHGILQARVLEWVVISFSRGLNPGLLHSRQTLWPLSYHLFWFSEWAKKKRAGQVQLLSIKWVIKWSLEKEMTTHSSTLAWKIPWMEEPGRLQSMGSQRVGQDWATSLSPSPKMQEVNERLDRTLSCKIIYLILKSVLWNMLFITTILFSWEYFQSLWMPFLKGKCFLF